MRRNVDRLPSARFWILKFFNLYLLAVELTKGKQMKPFTITVATEQHRKYAQEVSDALAEAAKGRGTGLAQRSAAYIDEKIAQGKAVIALYKEELAGFCYVESWEHERYVATSGLIVKPQFRGHSLAKAIKKEAFHLARRLFPGAKMFGLTTSLAVMRINSELGFVPVTFVELTSDTEFWKGCEDCQYYDVLERSGNKNCLCTGMLFDPTPKQKEWKGKKSSSLSLEDWTPPTQ